MDPAPAEPAADAVCDGGDLDCGSGLLLIIRGAMAPLAAGGVLEVRSRESSVREDLPAWCRMVGHALVAELPRESRTTSYFLKKHGAAGDAPAVTAPAESEQLAADLAKARSYQWQARVRWQQGMLARAYVRNHSLEVGQPASFDTADAACSAIELLLASLGGCLAVGLQWRASRRGIEIHDLEVTLSAAADNILAFLGLEEGNPGLARISGTAYVRADPGHEEALAELWQETLRRSPITQSLTTPPAIDVGLRLV